jgi:hypothetical protein
MSVVTKEKYKAFRNIMYLHNESSVVSLQNDLEQKSLFTDSSFAFKYILADLELSEIFVTKY